MSEQKIKVIIDPTLAADEWYLSTSRLTEDIVDMRKRISMAFGIPLGWQWSTDRKGECECCRRSERKADGDE